MNKPYWGLWALLLVSLALFVGLSFWADGITIGGFELKTATFAEQTSEYITGRNKKHCDKQDADSANWRIGKTSFG